MSDNKQFHVFHGRDNFSSDQVALIAEEVKNRRHILRQAVENLEYAVSYSRQRPRPAASRRKKLVKRSIVKHQSKKPFDNNPSDQPEAKVLKGKVSYKVKGPDGRLMNIAEVKAWVNSLYDGKQGIIKQ